MIAQAHIVAVKPVDQIKIPPHEPVAAIHLGKPALGNAGP
jgi:hypothetical protein